jgi:hypothetical protein
MPEKPKPKTKVTKGVYPKKRGRPKKTIAELTRASILNIATKEAKGLILPRFWPE